MVVIGITADKKHQGNVIQYSTEVVQTRSVNLGQLRS